MPQLRPFLEQCVQRCGDHFIGLDSNPVPRSNLPDGLSIRPLSSTSLRKIFDELCACRPRRNGGNHVFLDGVFGGTTPSGLFLNTPTLYIQKSFDRSADDTILTLMVSAIQKHSPLGPCKIIGKHTCNMELYLGRNASEHSVHPWQRFRATLVKSAKVKPREGEYNNVAGCIINASRPIAFVYTEKKALLGLVDSILTRLEDACIMVGWDAFTHNLQGNSVIGMPGQSCKTVAQQPQRMLFCIHTVALRPECVQFYRSLSVRSHLLRESIWPRV